MKACKVCGSGDHVNLWYDGGGNAWRRCLCCGSDSSEGNYPADLYRDGYVANEVASTGGPAAREDQVRSNCDWFPHYAHLVGGRDFLDVGCCDGAALRVMAALGWSVHGFDVTEDARQPGCTTIQPYFAASLFPREYHAILCREVLEHVEGPRGFLSELTAALVPGGLLQVQTPRPWHEPHAIPYQAGHLHLYSPVALELAVRHLGYSVLDRRFWPYGQAWLLHLTNKPG
jgi:SAM-dependent methyltransferase